MLLKINALSEFICYKLLNEMKTLKQKLLFLGCFFALWGNPGVFAQNREIDSLSTYDLAEIIIVSSHGRINHQKQQKPLSTIDEYFESSQNIKMIKRGAYAWEPSMNGMTSERLRITIDGMQIFGACTDKMDPVTSYVDVSNLSEIQIGSGQQSSAYGSTIGGGINLELDKSNFKSTGWKGTVESSYESNNNLRVFSGSVNYSDSKFYINTDGLYRKAENYKAGGGETVNFSQFEKYNVSLNTGFLISEGQSIAATLIYDEAQNVGYPALPMDVSLARAVISSISYNRDSLFNTFSEWETKLYYNSITHIMDDSFRPDVPIRMDMPGWSDTFGFYSQTHYREGKNKFLIKADGYFNKSLAEMTMYPPNNTEPSMFMLTWPDVHTLNLGLYLEDDIAIEQGSVKIAGRMDFHKNTVSDDFGLNSLRIFYPEMNKTNHQFLKSLSATYHRHLNNFHVEGGIAYGERAPSVSEGYGFYLFNSFDNYDYVGNVNLKTEASAEANVAVTFKKPLVEVKGSMNYFRIYNYILGKIDSSLSPMTIGAAGVKVYENLKYAQIANFSFSGKYDFSDAFTWSGEVSYHLGRDHENENLPLISPFSYRSSLDFNRNWYSASVSVSGAGKQNHFNADYGETGTAAYAVLSASFGKRFFINKNDLYLKTGVENIFDTYYTTYTDWNKIPRMGRNFYLTLSYSIN